MKSAGRSLGMIAYKRNEWSLGLIKTGGIVYHPSIAQGGYFSRTVAAMADKSTFFKETAG